MEMETYVCETEIDEIEDDDLRDEMMVYMSVLKRNSISSMVGERSAKQCDGIIDKIKLSLNQNVSPADSYQCLSSSSNNNYCGSKSASKYQDGFSNLKSNESIDIHSSSDEDTNLNVLSERVDVILKPALNHQERSSNSKRRGSFYVKNSESVEKLRKKEVGRNLIDPSESVLTCVKKRKRGERVFQSYSVMNRKELGIIEAMPDQVNSHAANSSNKCGEIIKRIKLSLNQNISPADSHQCLSSSPNNNYVGIKSASKHQEGSSVLENKESIDIHSSDEDTNLNVASERVPVILKPALYHQKGSSNSKRRSSLYVKNSESADKLRKKCEVRNLINPSESVRRSVKKRKIDERLFQSDSVINGTERRDIEEMPDKVNHHTIILSNLKHQKPDTEKHIFNKKYYETNCNKYRTYRDRNNEACRRSRLNRKVMEIELQQELISLQSKNIKLLSEVDKIESLIERVSTVLMNLGQHQNTGSQVAKTNQSFGSIPLQAISKEADKFIVSNNSAQFFALGVIESTNRLPPRLDEVNIVPISNNCDSLIQDQDTGKCSRPQELLNAQKISPVQFYVEKESSYPESNDKLNFNQFQEVGTASDSNVWELRVIELNDDDDSCDVVRCETMDDNCDDDHEEVYCVDDSEESRDNLHATENGERNREICQIYTNDLIQDSDGNIEKKGLRKIDYVNDVIKVEIVSDVEDEVDFVEDCGSDNNYCDVDYVVDKSSTCSRDKILCKVIDFSKKGQSILLNKRNNKKVEDNCESVTNEEGNSFSPRTSNPDFSSSIDSGSCTKTISDDGPSKNTSRYQLDSDLGIDNDTRDVMDTIFRDSKKYSSFQNAYVLYIKSLHNKGNDGNYSDNVCGENDSVSKKTCNMKLDYKNENLDALIMNGKQLVVEKERVLKRALERVPDFLGNDSEESSFESDQSVSDNVKYLGNKFTRIRKLNNISSRKSRWRRKLFYLNVEIEHIRLEIENRKLKDKVLYLETKIEKFNSLLFSLVRSNR